jgi:CHAT domain-containing protein
VETHAITMISSMFSVEEPPRPKQARPFWLVALASGGGTLRSAAAVDPVPKLQAATKEISVVVNFATHAMADLRQPMASLLVLPATGADGKSTYLTAGQVEGWRGVIATLWPIEDLLAQQFSADFYQRFTSGESAAQALSETQRAWLAPKPGASEAEQQRRRITALAHGFYTQ